METKSISIGERAGIRSGYLPEGAIVRTLKRIIVNTANECLDINEIVQVYHLASGVGDAAVVDCVDELALVVGATDILAAAAVEVRDITVIRKHKRVIPVVAHEVGYT